MLAQLGTCSGIVDMETAAHATICYDVHNLNNTTDIPRPQQSKIHFES